MSNKTTKLNEEKEQNNTKDKFNENVNILKEQGGPKGPEPTRYGDWEKPAGARIFNIKIKEYE